MRKPKTMPSTHKTTATVFRYDQEFTPGEA